VTPPLRLLSYAECAAIAGRSVKTISRWAARGLFPVTRMNGRPQVREAWFRKAIEENTSVEGREL
jgi:predicted DNA-binding transcriptional regulator AlpA